MESDRNEKDFVYDKGTIAALVKRRNAIKILIFLNNSEDVFYLQEIADALDMNEMTAFGNLSKLIDGGVVKKTWNKVDARTKYYEIIDKKLAERVIEKYKGRVAFRLARFVQYKRTLAKELKSDSRFVEACQFYGLSIPEGIIAVKQCPKIGCDGHDVIWRAEQGYIPPEKEPEKTETRKEPEVEEVE